MCKYKFRRQFLQTAVPLLLTVSMMLTGCGQTGNSDSPVRPILPDNSPDSSTVSSGEKLPDPVTIVVEDDSTPPAEGMVRSRLTNEWVDADVAATRPIAVMIPNEASAIPQYSLSDASIIYEANVENRMTRMMAIYEDWQNLDKIGNIRSLRDYYAYWAFEWDAFIVHFGGPFFINELLAQPDTQDVDGTSGSDEAAFLGLPDMDGVEIIRKIRSWSNMPIIVISARTEDSDKIVALDAGADDYLTKPFSVDELLARLRVTQRRLSLMKTDAAQESSIFTNGALKIDYAAGCAYLDGAELHLTPIEYKLLCLLSKNVGKVLTHTYITQQIWGSSWENDIASLRVFMATLRKKLERGKDGQQYIQTHIGIGYRMLRVE